MPVKPAATGRPEYPWTRDGLVRALVVEIVPRVGDLLFEIDPRTFQASVNLARAQFDNMGDIVKFLVEQVEGLKRTVEERQAEIGEANFEVEGSAAQAENARISLGRAMELLAENVNTQRDVDDKTMVHQVAVARLSAAKAKVSQMTAALAQAKADLARGLADLGMIGEHNPRLRRAAADLEIAQLNLDFTMVWPPTDGYVTNL